MNSQKHHYGLTLDEVQENRLNHGSNNLTPPEKVSLWKLFFEKFEDPVIRMLLFIAFLSLGVSVVENDFTESIGIIIAILLATGVAFWFEYDANKKFNILNLINDEILHKVYRNGVVTQVKKNEIVVGDTIILGTGEEVPADGELLEAVSLQVDESTLTGEPIARKSVKIDEELSDTTYPRNWVLRGTKVMDGHGIFQVKRVGDNTEFGKVARKATEITNEDTPLNKQLSRLAKFIGVVGTSFAVLTFSVLLLKEIAFGSFTEHQLGLIGVIVISMTVALTKIWLSVVIDLFYLLGLKITMPLFVEKRSWSVWMFWGVVTFLALILIGYLSGVNVFDKSVWIDIKLAEKILHFFMVAVTIVVVAVPEGLPMSVTLSLAMSMRRMLASNNLVRKMHACETMGATTVICTDKTGTLTQNRMKVQHDCIGGALDVISLSESLFYEGISVNSTAYLDKSDSKVVTPIGNPTEAALLLWLHEKGIDYLKLREDAPVIEHIPFSPERKWMATSVFSPLVQGNILYVKGAPEILLSMCSSIFVWNAQRTGYLSKEELLGMLSGYQAKAMRTIGFAYEIINDDKSRTNGNHLINENLIFTGIAAISDPLREDVPQAVLDCTNAGIDVKIVTGDTYGTAVEIARQIGIWDEDNKSRIVVSGDEFEKLSDDDATELSISLKVLYRARPTDKQRLVQLLQKRNEVVAVTGDGTNDAPALNYAHVGLSMGSGTYVAKEASDITLTDDSFKSIASAVMWGRSIYNNIQRFILFQLTINVTALLIVLIGSVFGSELPLTVTQMLWVNLIMDTFAAAALASLPPNREVMNKKPRDNNSFIINPQMSLHILITGIAFVTILMVVYFILFKDEFTRYDLSVYFTVFVMFQFWNMFNAKAFLTNKSAFAGITKSYGFLIIALLILVGQFIIVQFGGDIFRTTALKWQDWLFVISSTSFVLWFGELVRVINKRNLWNKLKLS